jgi:hypothetical protein
MSSFFAGTKDGNRLKPDATHHRKVAICHLATTSTLLSFGQKLPRAMQLSG